ncbi:hypothetical protein [Albidovulum sp.]|uniref:hypothetical protein n=1 Tax=Albidovulum sp. TaxID=1872424 RepID=UPI0039B92C21
MAERQDYRVIADGWVAGRRARAGETVRLTKAEARYEPVVPADDAQPAEVTPLPVARPKRRGAR